MGSLTVCEIPFGFTLGGMKPFRVAVARQAGMTEARIRSSEFSAPFHGVRAAQGIERDTRALASAYAVKMRRDAVFSHVTAAQLLGMPLPVRCEPSPLHVTVPPGTAPVRGRGIAGHRGGMIGSPVALDGLRMMSPPDAWVTLGAILDIPDLVAAADALMTPNGRHDALCAVRDLAAAVDFHARARGRARLREALPRIRSGAASRPESLLRVLLVEAGFPEPQLNFRVPGMPYRVDLAWPEFGFGIEYDGGHHRRDAQFRADVVRQEAIHDHAITLMRVQKEDLFDDPRGVVLRARRRVAGRGYVVPAREVSRMLLPCR